MSTKACRDESEGPRLAPGRRRREAETDTGWMRSLTADRGRRTASLGPIHSPFGVPDVEAPNMEFKRLGIVLTDAVHHQLVLRDELPTRIASLALGDTAEDLRTLVAG